MERPRKIVRQNRLQKYSRILSDKYNIKLELQNMGAYGFCDSTKHIFIKDNLDNDKFVNLILQKGVTLHELGHIIYTSSSAWKRIDRELSNVISDGRVEESMSRLYSRARLYFIYLNQKVLPVENIYFLKKEQLSKMEMELLLLEVILREAKKTTGIPQLPPSVIKKVTDKIGEESYKALIRDTRKAVNAKTEKEAAAITKEIEARIKRVLEKHEFESLAKAIKSSSKKSIDSCGSSARQMPRKEKVQEIEDDVLIDLLREAAEKMDIKPDKKELSEKAETDIPSKTISTDEQNKEEAEMQKILNETLNKKENEVDNEVDNEDSEVGDGLGGSKLDSLMDKVTNQIEDEIRKELTNEADILKSKEMEPDFEDYGLNKNDDLDVRTVRGFKKLPINVNDLEPIANRMSHLFKTIAEKGNGWYHNQTRGKLEITKVTRIIDNNPRVFRKRDRIENTDISAVILLDASGSMKHQAEDATKAAYIVTRALELGNYNNEVVQFGVRDTIYNSDLYGIKSFNQKVIYARERFVPVASGLTPMYKAICGAEKSLDKQNSKRKVLFVITDGYPTDDKTGEKCKAKIKDMERKGTIVVGLFIKTHDKKEIFNPKRSIQCNEINQLPQKMSGVIREILMTMKR